MRCCGTGCVGVNSGRVVLQSADRGEPGGVSSLTAHLAALGKDS